MHTPKGFLFLSIAFLFLICCQNAADSDSSKPQSIHDKIRADLADGLSHPNTIKVDETRLPSNKWVAERGHSSVSFRSRHWEIVDVIGWFDDFEVLMYHDSADFSDAVVFARANATSIVMPNFKMAETLELKEYLDAKNFTDLAFRSSSMEALGGSEYVLNGYMSIKGIERQLALAVTFNGFAYPEQYNYAGFNVEGKFNRFDFNIGPDARLHSGKKFHSDTIYFNCSLRMEQVPEVE